MEAWSSNHWTAREFQQSSTLKGDPQEGAHLKENQLHGDILSPECCRSTQMDHLAENWDPIVIWNSPTYSPWDLFPSQHFNSKFKLHLSHTGGCTIPLFLTPIGSLTVLLHVPAGTPAMAPYHARLGFSRGIHLTTSLCTCSPPGMTESFFS